MHTPVEKPNAIAGGRCLLFVRRECICLQMAVCENRSGTNLTKTLTVIITNPAQAAVGAGGCAARGAAELAAQPEVAGGGPRRRRRGHRAGEEAVRAPAFLVSVVPRCSVHLIAEHNAYLLMVLRMSSMMARGTYKHVQQGMPPSWLALMEGQRRSVRAMT